MSNYDALFEPLQIKRLEIRNQFPSTSHAPGLAVGGVVGERYIRYQAEKAKGGVGFAVRRRDRGVAGKLVLLRPDRRRGRGRRAAIPPHGGGDPRARRLFTVQLTHGGRRERWDIANWLPTYSASTLREIVHGSFPSSWRIMTSAAWWGISRRGQSRPRRRCGRRGNILPGGDPDRTILVASSQPENRSLWRSLREPHAPRAEDSRTVREAVGDDYVVGIRMPGDEMLKGGLTRKIACDRSCYAGSGLIDFISVVGGNAVDHQGEAKIWPTMGPFGGCLPLARAIRTRSPTGSKYSMRPGSPTPPPRCTRRSRARSTWSG